MINNKVLAGVVFSCLVVFGLMFVFIFKQNKSVDSKPAEQQIQIIKQVIRPRYYGRPLIVAPICPHNYCGEDVTLYNIGYTDGAYRRFSDPCHANSAPYLKGYSDGLLRPRAGFHFSLRF